MTRLGMALWVLLLPAACLGASQAQAPEPGAVIAPSPGAPAAVPAPLESMASPGWGLRLDGSCDLDEWDSEAALLYRFNRVAALGVEFGYLRNSQDYGYYFYG